MFLKFSPQWRQQNKITEILLSLALVNIIISLPCFGTFSNLF